MELAALPVRLLPLGEVRARCYGEGRAGTGGISPHGHQSANAVAKTGIWVSNLSDRCNTLKSRGDIVFAGQ